MLGSGYILRHEHLLQCVYAASILPAILGMLASSFLTSLTARGHLDASYMCPYWNKTDVISLCAHLSVHARCLPLQSLLLSVAPLVPGTDFLCHMLWKCTSNTQTRDLLPCNYMHTIMEVNLT